MIGIILLVIMALGVVYWLRQSQQVLHEDIATPKTSVRLKKLWKFVNTNFKGGRYKATERALLAILRIDHKNTAAYNRLGTLYARQKNYDDAIECFEIASGLTPTLATLYNLGVVHLEKGNFKQAANAFEKVVDLDPNVKRYLAFAKAQQKLGDYGKVAEILEEVTKLDKSPKYMELLAEAYSRDKQFEKSEEVRKKIAYKRSKKLLQKRSKAQTRRGILRRRVS